MVEFVADTDHPVMIPVEEVMLDGLLHIPRQAKGIVIFAHGSGSSRLSPRNQYIARELQEAQFATLLFDLLTREEDEIDNTTMEFRFDIAFLAIRLTAATQWLINNPVLHPLARSYFGASTGGGAALVAAAEEINKITSVVSRGGRPDLAGDALYEVQAATLLIVGGNDETVIEMNRRALVKLSCEKKLEVIPGASHLFEEPGKLEEVAKLAKNWFATHTRRLT